MSNLPPANTQIWAGTCDLQAVSVSILCSMHREKAIFPNFLIRFTTVAKSYLVLNIQCECTKKNGDYELWRWNRQDLSLCFPFKFRVATRCRNVLDFVFVSLKIIFTTQGTSVISFLSFKCDREKLWTHYSSIRLQHLMRSWDEHAVLLFSCV